MKFFFCYQCSIADNKEKMFFIDLFDQSYSCKHTAHLVFQFLLSQYLVFCVCIEDSGCYWISLKKGDGSAASIYEFKWPDGSSYSISTDFPLGVWNTRNPPLAPGSSCVCIRRPPSSDRIQVVGIDCRANNGVICQKKSKFLGICWDSFKHGFCFCFVTYFD